MKFAFILVEKAFYPITVLCRVLGVSRSGFHAWAKRRPSQHSRDDMKLAAHIVAAQTSKRVWPIASSGVANCFLSASCRYRGWALAADSRSARPSRTIVTITILRVRIASWQWLTCSFGSQCARGALPASWSCESVLR